LLVAAQPELPKGKKREDIACLGPTQLSKEKKIEMAAQ
jgi:hypothetical protein